MNVHLHRFHSGHAVMDAAALKQFQQQWATYQKMIDGDCMSHRAIAAILHTTLNEVFASPFSFLDIACGDAHIMKDALRGTQAAYYHGIDLSKPALDLAAANLVGVPFAVDLDHRDFVEAMVHRPGHADAAWCSLSIHHLATEAKRQMVRAIRRTVGPGGVFLLYEPTRLPGEDHATWFDRFARTHRPVWDGLTPAEWDQIAKHIEDCDFPETASTWCDIGRQAGFGSAREVFANPTGFLRLFRFDA